MTGYTTNIPNPPDDPSQDVGPMQSNTNAVNSWVQTDHIGFNVSSFGQHKQVTFNSNNVPTGTVTPPILFTNSQDGAGNTLPNSLAQLFFYSGTPTQGQDNYVSQASGSVMLMGGIILKWGQYTLGATSGNVPINFVPGFPNALFSLQGTMIGFNYNGSGFSYNINSTTKNQFFLGWSGLTIGMVFNYIAIGN